MYSTCDRCNQCHNFVAYVLHLCIIIVFITLILIVQAYGAQFVQKVHHRHVLARNYFSRVPGMMEKMEEKVSEMPLPRPKERVLIVPWRGNVNQTDGSQSGSKAVTPVVDPV